MIVTKFGGSSLANAEQFRKVKSIIDKNKDRKVVIVSAPGKRNSQDIKITDMLYTLQSHLKFHVPDSFIWDTICSRYLEIEKELGIDAGIQAELDLIKSNFSSTTDLNYLVSRGEYLSAKLMSAFLGFAFVDAADVMRFSFDGKFDPIASAPLMKAAYEKAGKMVVPGFYGAFPNGDIQLFSRGGSDVTGSYVSSFLKSEVYENWTDVSGICAADPRLATNPEVMKSITYEELRELSYMGANVLHEDSIIPVQDEGITINLRNTNDPENPGTIICQHSNDGKTVTGIAGKKGFVTFVIKKKHLSSEIGFLRKALSVFEKYNISVEHTPTGMDSISVVVSDAQMGDKIHSVISELETELDATVTIERGLALIALVGRNMAGKPGVCGTIFSILGENGINTKLIAQSTDELTVIVGVNDENCKKAIGCLYYGLHEKGLI